MEQRQIPNRPPDFREAQDSFWFHEMIVARRYIDGKVEAYDLTVVDTGNLVAIVTARGSFWNVTREANEAYKKWKIEQHKLLNSLITGDF